MRLASGCYRLRHESVSLLCFQPTAPSEIEDLEVSRPLTQAGTLASATATISDLVSGAKFGIDCLKCC
jgi:hypothetical protein